MIVLYIIFTICGVVLFLESFESINYVSNNKKNRFIGISFIVICIGLTIFASLRPSARIETVKETNKIVSISSESQLSGNFFLGIGKVEDKTYYFVFEYHENIGYQMTRYDYKRVYIVESNETPRIEKIKSKPADVFRYISFLEDEFYYKVYVPYGSIVYYYDVN